MRNLQALAGLGVVVSVGPWLAGCSTDTDVTTPATPLVRTDCVGCHSDEELLRATAAPDTVPLEDPGEG